MTPSATAIAPRRDVPARATLPATLLHGRFLEALSAKAMGPRLAGVLGGPPVCHVLDAKYEPGIYGHILYEQGGRLVRGDLEVERPASPRDAFHQSRVVAPGVRLWPFPGDPDLPTLALVMDPSILGPMLPGLPLDNRKPPARCRVSLLRYRPGRRATILITPASGRRYVAKVYHRADKAAAVAAGARVLSSSPQTGVLRFAPPAAYLADLMVVVQGAVAGRSLEMVIDGRHPEMGRVGSDVAAAARALAQFHALPSATARARSVDRELARFEERAERIAPLDPRVAASAIALAHRLHDTQRTLPAAPVGQVHGDCKPSAFLMGSDGFTYLLDLDHHGISDQMVDVGTFLATLRQRAIRRGLADQPAAVGLAAVADHFLEAYLAASGRGDLLPRIRWHEAVALERKALRAFSRAPLSPLPAALLGAANRILDEPRRPR